VLTLTPSTNALVNAHSGTTINNVIVLDGMYVVASTEGPRSGLDLTAYQGNERHARRVLQAALSTRFDGTP
jgi:hypothetical protein